MTLVEVVLWFCAGMIFYIYLGYPVVLWLVGSLGSRRRILETEEYPKVTIVISAFNERDCIGATIENKLALDYPADKKEIIVTSDESSDGTDEIVKTFEARGVRLIRQTPRRGKTMALNRMVAESKGNLVIFSDANSMYGKDALLKIVRNFSDPDTGYVTGKMVYVDEARSIIGSGCTAYMRYENALRSLETRFGSVIGVDGGIDAIRKCLYEPMTADMLPDFILPLRVIRQGSRVVFEEEALLHESTLTEERDEWTMRVRVILRSYHALSVMRDLLNPFRFLRTTFQILSHKILRYLVGVFQVFALVLNILLAGESAFYSWLLFVQGMYYLVAILGSTRRGAFLVPGARYSFYICLLNAAALVALVKFVKGEKQVVWTPRRG